LLSNAFKFTPEGGKIRVGVNESREGQDSFAEIQVMDTGRGIPAKELPFVFDRFYQVSAKNTREQEGTGIGLALARELVTLHGGTIHVESQEGFGSLFTVRLPMNQDRPALPGEVEQGADADKADVAAEKGYDDAYWPDYDELEPESELAESVDAPRDAPTILIVDDNADVREYLNSYLRGYYHIIEAADGVEGFDKTRAETGR
jgi:hypothetical protein